MDSTHLKMRSIQLISPPLHFKVPFLGDPYTITITEPLHALRPYLELHLPTSGALLVRSLARSLYLRPYHGPTGPVAVLAHATSVDTSLTLAA